MTNISRNFALKCYCIYEISKLSETEIKDRLEADYIDRDGSGGWDGDGEGSGEPIKYDSIYSSEVQEFLIRFYCEYVFAGASNEFLERFLKNCFKTDYAVIGKEKELFRCPCCGYLTLDAPGDYDICQVCFWEDSGITKDESYSGPNRATLGDYRKRTLEKIDTNAVPFKKA